MELLIWIRHPCKGCHNKYHSTISLVNNSDITTQITTCNVLTIHNFNILLRIVPDFFMINISPLMNFSIISDIFFPHNSVFIPFCIIYPLLSITLSFTFIQPFRLTSAVVLRGLESCSLECEVWVLVLLLPFFYLGDKRHCPDELGLTCLLHLHADGFWCDFLCHVPALTARWGVHGSPEYHHKWYPYLWLRNIALCIELMRWHW